jgi:hypothetical protein
MQYDKHETDLYILPETIEERKKIKDILETKFSNWFWMGQFSNVEGQAWYCKQFIEIPFGIDLKDGIQSLMKG